MGVHTNLSLLIRLLLNKQQILLFKHQNDRAVSNSKQQTGLPKLDLADFLSEKPLKNVNRFDSKPNLLKTKVTYKITQKVNIMC